MMRAAMLVVFLIRTGTGKTLVHILAEAGSIGSTSWRIRYRCNSRVAFSSMTLSAQKLNLSNYLPVPVPRTGMCHLKFINVN
jgi:hypothetical protein